MPYRGIQRHTGGIVRLFSKRFPCLDQFDAVMSELHHHRFAVAAFRALERPLVMIWIVSRIDPRKKQRHAADKASTFSKPMIEAGCAYSCRKSTLIGHR